MTTRNTVIQRHGAVYRDDRIADAIIPVGSLVRRGSTDGHVAVCALANRPTGVADISSMVGVGGSYAAGSLVNVVSGDFVARLTLVNNTASAAVVTMGDPVFTADGGRVGIASAGATRVGWIRETTPSLTVGATQIVSVRWEV